MTSRRSFVKGLSLLGLTSQWHQVVEMTSQSIWSNNEINWDQVRALFPVTSWEKIHLNSGSAGVLPTPVQDHLVDLMKYVNTKAAYQVWNEWQPIKKNNIERLASMIRCDHDELQIVRNTTEALNMIIYGLRLNVGDEVVLSRYDYPFAINAWKNRAARDGIVLKYVDLTLPLSNESIVAAYDQHISSKTKVVHITHMTHKEGHIMPVKELCKLADGYGIEAVIDGAHVVGQIDVDLMDIGCGYFASSLHKWLNAPLGTGLLFVKRNKINKLYNYPSSNLDASDSIDKFEHRGTRAWANEIGISAALDFHEMIGMETKKNRLQALKEYWTSQVLTLSTFQLHTVVDPEYSGAVASFSINGQKGKNIVSILNKEFDIHAKSISSGWGSGVRISVNVFTSYEELDHLVAAITDICGRS